MKTNGTVATVLASKMNCAYSQALIDMVMARYYWRKVLKTDPSDAIRYVTYSTHYTTHSVSYSLSPPGVALSLAV
jgi:hypothetical protein